MSSCGQQDRHRQSSGSSGCGNFAGRTSHTACVSCFSSCQSSLFPSPTHIQMQAFRPNEHRRDQDYNLDIHIVYRYRKRIIGYHGCKVAKTLVSAAELRNEKNAFGVVRVTIYMKRKMAVLYMGFRVGLAP